MSRDALGSCDAWRAKVARANDKMRAMRGRRFGRPLCCHGAILAALTQLALCCSRCGSTRA